jgi:hypothetical protein
MLAERSAHTHPWAVGSSVLVQFVLSGQGSSTPLGPPTPLLSMVLAAEGSGSLEHAPMLQIGQTNLPPPRGCAMARNGWLLVQTAQFLRG